MVRESAIGDAECECSINADQVDGRLFEAAATARVSADVPPLLISELSRAIRAR